MAIQITNETYLEELRKFKASYADFPWYQRFWFALTSFSLWSALDTVDPINPTVEQVNDLLQRADEAWFFNTIFNLLTQFREAIGKLGLIPRVQHEDIKTEITSYLDLNEISALSSISKEGFALFKPVWDTR